MRAEESACTKSGRAERRLRRRQIRLRRSRRGALEPAERRALYEQRSRAARPRWPRAARSAPIPASTPAARPRTSSSSATPRPRTTVWWDNNGAITPAQFDLLLADFIAHAEGKELFAQDLYGGADPAYRVKARVFTEFAWHSLFIRNLLIRPERAELAGFVPDLTIVDLPSLQGRSRRATAAASETVIAFDFTRKIVLIGGTSYAGEMKKSVFTYLNYCLPAQGRHADALLGQCRPATATRRSSSACPAPARRRCRPIPNRTLIGDDEHGWAPNGIFNFEGGCYAKTIRLSREAEPEIFATTERFGTVLENVVLDPDHARAGFRRRLEDREHPLAPIRSISSPTLSATGRAGHPKNIVMLTADAFGVMPPIAKLTPAQAMYHFLSGYTAKVAGTEKGLVGVRAGPSRPASARRSCRAIRRLRQPAARPHRQARRRLLARQHRLDRRRLRRRPAHADPRRRARC